MKLVLVALMVSALAACTPTQTTKISANWPTSSLARMMRPTLWTTMRRDFHIRIDENNPAIAAQIARFQRQPKPLIKAINEASPYLYYIVQQTQKKGVPAELALLPIVESEFDPFAWSRVGATGLWQMMPGTASGLGVKINWWYDGRRDIVASTNAALKYLVYLDKFFKNDWVLAIAAYDSGEGTVQRAIRKNQKLGQPTDFWHLKLPHETSRYVPKVLALAAIIKHPGRYHITLPNIPNRPYLTEVTIGKQIDLAQAAKLAGISLKTLRQLNPGFRRWATDPDGPHTLLIPIKKAPAFKQKLASIKKGSLVKWHRHAVRPGDILSKLAKRYKTTVHIIRDVNKLKNTTLHLGQTLQIPVSARKTPQGTIKTQHASIAEDGIPGPKGLNYRVQRGDTLSTLAKRFSVNVRELSFWNGLQPSDTLQPGDKLILWVKERPVPVASHTVRRGDSLIRLAKRYHTSITLLRRMNKIKGNTIRLGQHLTIYRIKHYSLRGTPQKTHKPIHYTVKNGDVLGKIAHRYKTTVKRLQALNHLPSKAYLHPGQRLIVKFS